MFSAKEEAKYGYSIKEKAETFRKGSRLTLTFLDKENNQTGDVFRIAGLYDITNNMFERLSGFVLKR